MIDYFDLLKGSGGSKAVNQHDGFGDLLSECRVSAKEKVNETIEVFQNKDDAAKRKDEIETEIPRSRPRIRRIQVDAEDISHVGLRGIGFADDLRQGDLGYVVDDEDDAVESWGLKSRVIESKVDEKGKIAETAKSEVIELLKQGKVVYGVVEDTDGEGYLVGKISDLKEYEESGYWDIVGNYDTEEDAAAEAEKLSKEENSIYIGVVESKVNELDEPDLERPEKARRKPKRKKPPVEEPVSDEELKEKPPEEEEPEVPEIDKEPDPDEVPPPPEEIKEPERPIEMRKEYLGRTEDVHYYFITTEGEGGIIDDFVIADQEGVKKYSAKDQDIEVSEENIADFIIQAYRDVEIAQIERSIYMKYLYPELTRRAPEEELVEEPVKIEGEEEDKGPLAPEEEELPRESKKITEQEDAELTDGKFKVGDKVVGIYADIEGVIVRQTGEDDPEFDRLKDKYAEMYGVAFSETTPTPEPPFYIVDVDGEEELFGGSELKIKETKESCLIEMKVTDGIGNEFDVNLAADDTEDAVIDINGREFRFSPEFASMWKDEEGNISEEGLEELALDALAMMEEGEYQELLTNGREEYEEPSEERGSIEVDEKPETKPEHEIETIAGDEERTTDDVDVSKGDIHRRPKYRSREKSHARPSFGGLSSYYAKTKKIEQGNGSNEGKNQPGIRDGTGPAKDSAQRSVSDVGRRKQAGEKCPKEKSSARPSFGSISSYYAKVKKAKKDTAKKIEDENIERDNEMIEKKTVAGLVKSAEEAEKKAKALRKEAKDLAREEAQAKAKKEGIDPKKEDSEEKKIKKLAEEEELTETDVAKGAKALISLAKDALKAGNYTEAAEHCAKLAEIEAVIPPEADAEVKKEDKAEPAKKDDKEDKKPEKKDDKEEPAEDNDNADEKKKPPVCKKCGKRHWPFQKCSAKESISINENTRQMIDTIVKAYQQVGVGTKPGLGDSIIQDMIESYWGERSDYEVREEGIYSIDAGELCTWEDEKEFIASECSEEKVKELYDLALDRLATVGKESEEDVDEAKKDKKDKKAKKDKKEKEAKAKKANAKKVKAKKENRIPVESTEDISEKKGLNLLSELLGMKD